MIKVCELCKECPYNEVCAETDKYVDCLPSIEVKNETM